MGLLTATGSVFAKLMLRLLASCWLYTVSNPSIEMLFAVTDGSSLLIMAKINLTESPCTAYGNVVVASSHKPLHASISCSTSFCFCAFQYTSFKLFSSLYKATSAGTERSGLVKEYVLIS